MIELQRRTTVTLDTFAKFEGKHFDWSKQATCAHILRHHGRAMGHKMPTVPNFRSAFSARSSLNKMGFDSMASLLDSLFPRIPPLAMLVGDIMTSPSEIDIEGILIRASPSKFIGWSEYQDGCTLIDVDMSYAIGAWRL